MSAFVSGLTRLVDSVFGLQARRSQPLEGDRELPCNMFSGFMIFGCRQACR